MRRISIHFPSPMQEAIWAHLLGNAADDEEAAFAFATIEHQDAHLRFRVTEWYPVTQEDLEERGPAGIELTDVCRAKVIKMAHDRGTSLVEFHSHPFPLPAGFSLTDREGFVEFVPHVWWRLRHRPYAAVVVAPTSADALAWIDDPLQPCRVDGLVADATFLPLTQHSIRYYEGTGG
jgi:hypothetical protein